MAVLTPDELARVRRGLRTEWEDDMPVDFEKLQVNQAVQTLEDWYEGEKSTVSQLIDTASSPYVFTGRAKKLLGQTFLIDKWDRTKAEPT